MKSPEAGVFPYLFKEQVEKNAVLINVLQIAFDAFKLLASETDPEKISKLAKDTVEIMTRSLDERRPAQVIRSSEPGVVVEESSPSE